MNQNIPCLAGVCCDAGCASAAADAQQCGGGDEGGFEVSAGAVAEISGGSLQGDGVAGDQRGTGECQISCGRAGGECDMTGFRCGGQIRER